MREAADGYRAAPFAVTTMSERSLLSFINAYTAVLPCTASIDKIELMIYKRSVHG